MVSRQRCPNWHVTQALGYIDMSRGGFAELVVVPRAQRSKQFNTRVRWRGVVSVGAVVWCRCVVYMTRLTRTAETKQINGQMIITDEPLLSLAFPLPNIQSPARGC